MGKIGCYIATTDNVLVDWYITWIYCHNCAYFLPQIKFSNLLLWNQQEVIMGLWVKPYSYNSWGFFLPQAPTDDRSCWSCVWWWFVVNVAVIQYGLAFTSKFHDLSGWCRRKVGNIYCYPGIASKHNFKLSFCCFSLFPLFLFCSVISLLCISLPKNALQISELIYFQGSTEFFVFL